MEPGSREDRFVGCLLGLAVGDAIGASVEFMVPGSFEPVTGVAGGGPHGLEPGEWTDDTSMALCLATSLLECEGFDPSDQMRRYVRWWREGYMSSVGECFDIGNTIRDALSSFEQAGEPYSGSTHARSAGNGSIMRLAPVPMFYANDLGAAVARCADSSRTTHGAQEAVDACRYLGALLVGLLSGAGKDAVLDAGYVRAARGVGTATEAISPEDLAAYELRSRAGVSDARLSAADWAPAILEIAGGSFRRREPPEIKGSGYVVKSLEAALWAFNRAANFRDGCLLAVNLGDDADTTGAIFGQLAGACYGASGIPGEWLAEVAWREEITDLALQLERASRREAESPGV